MCVPVTRGKRTSILLVRERIQRVIVHEGFRDGATAIRVKAKPGFLPSQDSCIVSIAISSDM